MTCFKPIKKGIFWFRYNWLFFRTFSLLRLLNLIQLGFSLYVAILVRRPWIKGLPTAISIEPINICNLKCPECPTGISSLTRPKGTMSVDYFSKVLKSISKRTWFLNLYFQGEPTMHPQFAEMVQLSKKEKLITASSTNAHYIDEKMAERIVESGLDYLIISVDGLTQSTYERYRVGGDLNKVCDGITNLVDAKRRLRRSYPLLEVQFLAFKYNEYEIDKLWSWAMRIGVDIVKVKTAQIYNVKNKLHLIPENKKYSRYNINVNQVVLKGMVKNNCWKQWSSCVITWDGNIVPCCFDKDASYKMGNILQKEFKTLWTDMGFNLFRNEVLNNQDEIDICKNCPMSRNT